MKKMQRKRRRYSGRYLMLVGAIALLIWSAYELWIRLDDFQAWTSGVRYMSAAKGESFIENLRLILQAPAMRELFDKMLFLAGCTVFSIVAICLRNRPRADIAVLILDAVLLGLGMRLQVFTLQISMLTQSLKALPLLGIAAACIVNIVQYILRRRRRRRRPADSKQGRESRRTDRAA